MAPPCPRGVCGPRFLGHLSNERDHRTSRAQCRTASSGQQLKVLPLRSESLGFWARSFSTNIKDSQDCSGSAKLITANAGEKNRPTAGTRSGFCYTRTQLVTVFAITDLASVQEEHTIKLPRASADRGRGGKERERGDSSSYPVTESGGTQSHLAGEGWVLLSTRNP